MMCINRAKAHKENADNLTWGTYMKTATMGKAIGNAVPSFKHVGEIAEK